MAVCDAMIHADQTEIRAPKLSSSFNHPGSLFLEGKKKKSLKYFLPISELLNRSYLAQMVKNLPAMQEMRVRSLGREDPLEEGMTAHSGILAWRIAWTEEPGGFQSTGSQRSDTTALLTLSCVFFMCFLKARDKHLHVFLRALRFYDVVHGDVLWLLGQITLTL